MSEAETQPGGGNRRSVHARRRIYRRRRVAVGVALAMVLGATAWATQEVVEDGGSAQAAPPGQSAARVSPSAVVPSHRPPTEQMSGAGGIYHAITTGQIPPAVRDIKARVYVPNNTSNTVDVIDPQTFRVI